MILLQHQSHTRVPQVFFHSRSEDAFFLTFIHLDRLQTLVLKVGFKYRIIDTPIYIHLLVVKVKQGKMTPPIIIFLDLTLRYFRTHHTFNRLLP